MSNLVSSVELKKADGKPITFNFQFENGLPMKPLFEAPYVLWISKKTKRYGVTIKLNDSLEVNDFTLNNVTFHNTKKESKDIWIHLPQCYFVVKNVKNNIVEKMKSDGIGIAFLDKNGNQL
jgi:hypothetical protein